MINFVSYIINTCAKIGQYILFTLSIFCSFPHRKHHYYEIIIQFYYVTVESISLILPTALFIGGVLVLQGVHTLERFGTEQEIGQVVSLSIVRELGPVIAALLFAGRTGSALASEIGVMKVEQQFIAMKMMNINSHQYILFTRLISGFLGLPILTIIFNTFSIIGAYFIATKQLHIDSGLFWIGIKESISHIDIQMGIIKSIAFGLLITSIALYNGYHCKSNSHGVSHAATYTVITTSIAILITDYVLTSLILRIA